MNNLFDKIGSDLKSFSPEAPAYMEERIQKAVMSQKSKMRFWFSLNAVLLLIGITAVSVYCINQDNPSVVAQAAVTNQPSARPMVQEASVAQSLPAAVAATPVAKKNASGNLSAQAAVTTPVIKETCVGTPETVETTASNASTENTVQVQEVSNVKEEVIKSEEVPAKKRRSLPITRLHNVK